jgi:hypothetical protein
VVLVLDAEQVDARARDKREIKQRVVAIHELEGEGLDDERVLVRRVGALHLEVVEPHRDEGPEEVHHRDVDRVEHERDRHRVLAPHVVPARPQEDLEREDAEHARHDAAHEQEGEDEGARLDHGAQPLGEVGHGRHALVDDFYEAPARVDPAPPREALLCEKLGAQRLRLLDVLGIPPEGEHRVLALPALEEEGAPDRDGDAVGRHERIVEGALVERVALHDQRDGREPAEPARVARDPRKVPRHLLAEVVAHALDGRRPERLDPRAAELGDIVLDGQRDVGLERLREHQLVQVELRAARPPIALDDVEEQLLPLHRREEAIGARRVELAVEADEGLAAHAALRVDALRQVDALVHARLLGSLLQALVRRGQAVVLPLVCAAHAHAHLDA